MTKIITTASKILLVSSLILTVISLGYIKPTYASSITTDKLEYKLEAGDFEFGSLKFTSTEKEILKISVSVKAYDPKEEVFIDTKPFIGLQQTNFTIKPNETITIEYAISIPEEQPIGTYFNVIAIEPVKAQTGPLSSVGVSIKNGFGALLTFNIQEANNTIDKVFIDKSDTQIIVERRGFPFLSPLRLRYIFVNNSNFVFRPEGEIRITNQGGKQIDQRVQINPDNKAIYPSEKIEIVKEFKVWDNIDEIFDKKVISARTYNGFTENYLTNQVEVMIREQIITAGVILLAGAIAIVVVAAKLLSRKKHKRPKKEQSE